MYVCGFTGNCGWLKISFEIWLKVYKNIETNNGIGNLIREIN